MIMASYRSTSLSLLLHEVVAELQSKDLSDIFAEPVKESEVPGYHNVIKRPMSFAIMTGKIDNNKYRSVSELEQDLILMTNNCMKFNGKGSKYYTWAKYMRQHAEEVIELAKITEAAPGFDQETGLNLSNTSEEMNETTDDEQDELRTKKPKKTKSKIGSSKRKVTGETSKSDKKRRTSGFGDDVSNLAATSSNSQDDNEQTVDVTTLSDKENSKGFKGSLTKSPSSDRKPFSLKKRLLNWKSRSSPNKISMHSEKSVFLSVESKSDQSKLAEGKNPAVRKNVEAAYQRALLHRRKPKAKIPLNDDEKKAIAKQDEEKLEQLAKELVCIVKKKREKATGEIPDNDDDDNSN